MNKRENKVIVCLCLIVFMLSIPSLFTSNYNSVGIDGTLKTSTNNYLFNGVEYDITLDDVYDDENSTKIYTGANFQTSSFNYTTYDWNDSESDPVSPVNNTEIDKASPSGHYPATYSFDDQPVGTSGTNIYYVASV